MTPSLSQPSLLPSTAQRREESVLQPTSTCPDHKPSPFSVQTRTTGGPSCISTLPLRCRSLSNHSPIPTPHCSTRVHFSPRSNPHHLRSSAQIALLKACPALSELSRRLMYLVFEGAERGLRSRCSEEVKSVGREGQILSLS